jgi:organic hydroperoxide reductase OsmC/OhrA
MLTFVYLAGKAQFQVESYEDEAVGVMSKNEKGVPWVSAITLHPKVVYSGAKQPTQAEVDALHHKAHEYCYVAASIKTQVTVAASSP